MARVVTEEGDASSSASSVCAGCNKPLDPLRAGHVAIVGNAFRYFCRAECKELYADASSRRVVLDAMTADPPPAAVTSSALPPVVILPPDSAPALPAAIQEASPTETAGDDGGAGDVNVQTAPPQTPAPPDETPIPLEQTAPSTSRDRAEPLARALDVAAVIGIGAGILAVVVPHTSDPALRVSLAIASALVVAACAGLRPRARSESSRWVVAVPIAVAAITAASTFTMKDRVPTNKVDAYAAFVGLAAAAALFVDRLLCRARRGVESAHARVARRLDVRARVVAEGDETTEMEASHVKPGEQVVVEEGDTVGVDGIVTAGNAEVAPWIDSAIVVAKREGDAVVAGASVVSGRLRVRATFTGTDRAWVRCGAARGSRTNIAAPLVVFARRTVERGVPVVIAIVALAAYASNDAWPDIVMAACAGAYGLAAAAAVSAAALAHTRGHMAAQRRGIVYKDAESFDVAARADRAVLCSRGTILLGEPKIVTIETIGDVESDHVLSLAAGAEMASNHAVSAAVVGEARVRGVRPENVRSALVYVGLGVTALVPNGDKVIVGSRALLLKEKVSVAIADARVSELEAEGKSVLLVALGDRLIGLLALQDGLRRGARAAIQRLHNARIEPVLLSGEARETCETIARALDIEHVRPEILPVDRGAEVRALADGGHVVAAIGHAASDDGALGAADLSVAMSAAGSVPGEWGVALASNDVRDAALALTVPRACRERARMAFVVGAAAQSISLLGIVFRIAPPVVAPIVSVVAAAAVLAIVREPTRSPTS
ncbi:MAG: HAD-IC family P-type ATPase [Polyangiaceae bacterium]|nr:HAD-IC family P-type ATPase [Polyangiaceae bacterium]